MNERIRQARHALDGLSVGDAFGERFFRPPAEAERMIGGRDLPDGPWQYTDDTVMALSVFETLAAYDGIDQDALAERFVERYMQAPDRGYGAGAHRLLMNMRRGEPWQSAAAALFRGTGSFGNGAAMRVAPVGAFFSGDLQDCAEHARRSAVVTHMHAEGQAGAIAVAIATASACQGADADEIFDAVTDLTPPSEVRDRVERARDLDLESPVEIAASRLGNGSEISAQDTVAFCIWAAARNLDDYEEAMWTTVSALGDRDTTCAIVGGILGGRLGRDSIPELWLERREPLPDLTEI